LSSFDGGGGGDDDADDDGDVMIKYRHPICNAKIQGGPKKPDHF